MRFSSVSHFLIFILVWLGNMSNAQNVALNGTPAIQNFNENEIVSAGKIWQIAQAPNGIMYMAGDVGLIEFDGINWRQFKGSQGFTRSLVVLNDSVIYSGSDLDFGIWRRNGKHEFEYQSLFPFKENARGVIEEFWHTFHFGSSIIFQSHENLYILENEQLIKIPAPSGFTGAFQSGQQLFVTDKQGLFEYDGVQLSAKAGFPSDKTLHVNGISGFDEQISLYTRDHGIFNLKNGNINYSNYQANPELVHNRIFSHSGLINGYQAVGTILGGLYILDNTGEIIQHINKKKGLTDNTVLAVFQDAQNNLWLSLDYGLTRVKLNSPYTYFIDYAGNSGTVETAALYNDHLYIGTNQGLFVAPWSNLQGNKDTYEFERIPGSEGQIWSLKIIDNQLVVGHDRGLFRVNYNMLYQINDNPGVLDITQWNQYLITGTYNGIDIFEKKGGKWEFIKKPFGISGACKKIIIQNNDLWVNIPNFGIVKFNLNQALEIINVQNFLSDEINLNNVDMKLKNDTLWLKSIHQNWYFNSKENKFKTVNNSLYIPDFAIASKPAEFFLKDNFALQSVFNGFALRDISYKIKNATLKPIIRKATYYHNNSSYNFGQKAHIPHKYNNIKFQFVLPGENQADLQYFLIHNNDTVKGRTTTFEQEFVDLSYGSYKFIVADQINSYNQSEPFVFNIMRPWYLSWWSVLLYLAVLAGIIFILHYFQKLSLKKQKLLMLKKNQESLPQQSEKHRQKLHEMKQKQLESERLELEKKLKEKTLELTALSKENRDKRRVLGLVHDKFLELEKNPNTPNRGIKMNEIRRNLDEFFKHEDDHVFEIQIDELHQQFYKKIKSRFPDLTTYDLRLAAYLKLGMSTKEIAKIVDVLPSSINVSRSRLRKKMDMHSDDDLFEFLNQF